MARWTRFIVGDRKKEPAVHVSERRSVEEAVLEGPAFMAAVEGALRGGRNRGVVVAALSLDDVEGAAALLVAAESRIARVIRPGDVIGRLGQGRLAVLAGRDEGPDGAARITERIADRLAEPFHIAGREMEVGLRIGVASGDRDAAALLELAEESMATIRADGA